MGPKGDPKATLRTQVDPKGAQGDPKGAQHAIFTNFEVIFGAKMAPKTVLKSGLFCMFF